MKMDYNFERLSLENNIEKDRILIKCGNQFIKETAGKSLEETMSYIYTIVQYRKINLVKLELTYKEKYGAAYKSG